MSGLARVERLATTSSARELRDAVHDAAVDGRHLVIVDPALALDDETVAILLAPLDEPGIASASPVPAGPGEVATYPLHDALPPAPTLAAPWVRLCSLAAEAVASLTEIPEAGSFDQQLARIGERLLQLGWRHVAAPGLAARWDPAPAPRIPTAAWTATSAAGMVGPANAALETHRLWARSRLAATSVVIDGACLGGDLHTGTQHVVLQIARWLKATRPTAEILVATPAHAITDAERLLAGTGVAVAERDGVRRADVLYRPYQMLRGDELDFVERLGHRTLVGQLDMIGFSNPFYHPSSQLFALARNLQRHLMRTADGVTFISEYGRQAGLAECPDLEPRRLFVVSCGADPVPVADRHPPVQADVLGRFLACVSATFWHKNRGHAIATFASLVEESAYEGSLVIVGPEPFYGRSTDADDALLARLPEKVRDRVHRWGTVTDAEKWWLLEHADAVLYPSVVEGFGLIPFEAAAVGTPCLTYAGTAPGEVLAGTASVMTTWVPSQWARRVADWVADDQARTAAVDEIAQVASGLTWKQCAERTWEAIDATLARPRRAQLAEEGDYMSRVADPRRTRVRASAVRFFLARAQPALSRRIRRAWSSATHAGGRR